MKNFKKFTILLLSLVMAFSCLAIFAFAEDDGEAAKIKEIGSLVEYYNEEGIFVCDPFAEGAAGNTLKFAEDSAGAYTEVDGKTVYAATLDGKNVLYSPEITVPSEAEGVVIIFSFRVSAGSADKGYLAFEFSGSSKTEDATDAQSLLVFDYNEGKAYFASMSANVMLSSQEIEGFVPQDGAWCTVSMIYDRAENAFTGKVGVEGGEEYAFEYALEGMIELATLQLRNRNIGNAGVNVAWDLLEVYEGTFFRSNLEGERQKFLDEKLYTYMQAYETASDAVKTAIIESLVELMEKGYAPEAGSDTEAYYNDTFVNVIENYHWDNFVAKVSAFDTSLKYDERVAALNEAKAPEAAYPVRPVNVTEADYEAIIAKYEAEADVLDVIGEHSQALIDLVPALSNPENYKALLDALLAFEAEREYLRDENGVYVESYFGLSHAIEIYENALVRFADEKKFAMEFIAAVDAMQVVQDTNFGQLYDAYSAARRLMADDSFNFVRDSYFAELVFDTVDGKDGVWYDARFYAFDSVAENGKSAAFTVDGQPYTITLSNYTLILESEGITLVFGSGTELDGTWTLVQTVLTAYDLFETRKVHIENGAADCRALISDISVALVAQGYDVRVEKRAEILAKYADVLFKYEEGGMYFGFEGVADALAAFDAFCDKIDAYKALADEYIALVEELKAAPDYAAVLALINKLTPMYAAVNERGFEGYENEVSKVQDANNIYNANKSIIVEAESNAFEFVAKVNAAAATDDLNARLVALRAAQKLFTKLKDGATGVAEAKALFAAEKASYLADASAMNESAKEQGEALVGIALANVKFAAPEKLVFIVKKVYEL